MGDTRKDKSRKKYGWYSGSSEEDIQKDMKEKGYEGKYENFKKGLGIENKEDKKKEKKKSRFNFFN